MYFYFLRYAVSLCNVLPTIGQYFIDIGIISIILSVRMAYRIPYSLQLGPCVLMYNLLEIDLVCILKTNYFVLYWKTVAINIFKCFQSTRGRLSCVWRCPSELVASEGSEYTRAFVLRLAGRTVKRGIHITWQLLRRIRNNSWCEIYPKKKLTQEFPIAP